MKKYYIPLFFFFFSASILFAQQPNLWLEGNVTVNTTFDDGFEDVNLPPFTSGGAASWQVQSVEAYAGTYAAQSGIITHSQSTLIQNISSITEPSTINFALKVSSESGWDFLSFKVNGSVLLSLSGEVEWQLYSYDLPVGTDTLEWIYSKDNIVSAGSDAAWLDSVTIQNISGQVLQISDGLQGAGKVLISDAVGKATWVSPKKIFDSESLPLILHKDMPVGTYGPEDYAPLIVENSLGAGIRIRQASVGIRIDSTSNYGFQSFNSGFDGFYSDNSGRFGFYSLSAGNTGILSNGSGGDGIWSANSGGDGFYSVGNTGDEGYFSGTVTVTGNLSKGGGSFKIDHPLDPENKFLYHSFVESPDMMNVYNGNIITDEEGQAVVEMPDWFDVLNRDFRYQLTVIRVFSQAIIKEKMNGNQFTIQTDQPNVEVSWQVTGIRQDPYANQNRIEVEVDKPAEFKGQYIHPEAYDQPFEKGFDYVKLSHKTLEELDAEHAAESMEQELKQEKIKREADQHLELLHDQQKEMVDKKEN